MSSTLFDLSGKVALVTGGNGGIGLAMAEGIAAAGAAVAIWGTNEAKNASALARLQSHGVNVQAFVCDVADEAAVDAQFAATVEHFGHVDACFANAGISGGGGPFETMSTEAWRRVLSVNLDGTFFTFRAAARHMIERGEGGSLVATSSVAAIAGSPRNEHYAASKAGILALVRGLAVELARHRITVNSILPGWVATDMTTASQTSERFAERVFTRIPARRWGTPEDFAAPAVYLMSDGARYHTGETMVIDGGYSKF